MPRHRCALALLLVPALACQPVPISARGGDDATAPDAPFRAAATGEGMLVFPPEPATSPRRTLPRRMAKDEHTEEAPTEVEWPELDRHGRFEFAGRTLSIHFNRSIAPPAEGVPALTVTPAVDGTISWPNPWVLNFQASEPFDPDTDYTVALASLTDVEGKAVAEGWTGVFRAEPRVSIAGKIINYLPEAGTPRAIAVRPDYDPVVGRNVKPTVLFDQPIDLAKAATLISATVGSKGRSLTLQHPKEDRYDGYAIDREQVVIATPDVRPKSGERLQVTVNNPDGTRFETHTYEVAAPLAFRTVDCQSDYYYDEHDDCEYKDGTLKLEGRRFALRLNNTVKLSDKTLKRLVTVSPPVKNLRVSSDTWRSDGTVWVSGDFRSSTRYTVKVGRLEDRFGSKLSEPLRLTVKVAPQASSVSMPEGQQLLDESASRKFTVSTRNVEQATLKLWEIEATPRAWEEARRRLGAREEPVRAPDLRIPIRPKARRDRLVKTSVDLLDSLSSGKTYLARLELDTPAFGASPPSYPEWAMAARPPTALVTPHDSRALAVHVHSGRDQTLVHVARLADGTPIRGAQVLVDGARVTGVRTGSNGMAVLPRSLDDGTGRERHHIVEVEAHDTRAVLALGGGTLDEGDLAPELSGKHLALDDFRGLIISDRGVYRPGATVNLKGMVQWRKKGALRAATAMPVSLRIFAPTGKQVFTDDGLTSALGSHAVTFDVPASAEIGRYRVELVATMRDEAVIATYGLQVAEFEPPRFTVDVEAKANDKSSKLLANVDGRYLFGAAMEDASVAWTVRRKPAPFPRGPLTSKGLHFRTAPGWWEDEDPDSWVRVGEGTLDAKGQLSISPAVEMHPDQGPQRFALEAEVTDESHRSIAGRASVVLHPTDRYAGLRLNNRWLGIGKAIGLEAGVIDQSGATVPDAAMEIKLERLEWKRVRRPGPGGYAHSEWHEVAKPAGSCKVQGSDTSKCRLVPRRSGSYRVTAVIDGRRGGSMRAWAWGSGESSAEPSPGRRIEIIADRDRYKPGETAELMVRNPFGMATAILTVEQGGILHHETKSVSDSAVRFSVPLTLEHAPHAHATVTLLPRNAEGAQQVDWKLGAIRLPVELVDTRLDVVVASDQDRYEPGDEVDIVIDVSRGGRAVENAEVALAVVDEGVLRLTNFHATDPVPQLYPGQGLDLWVDDNRRLLAEQLRRSHVAGDGSGGGSHSLVSTRKNFVKTALWRPELRTDADGRAHAHFTLPDNLTRFRMMAVVIDGEGRGGVHEDDFEVQMPLMAIPAVPRFAAIGDRFEAAVLVHNNQDHPEEVTVTLGTNSKNTKTTTIAAGGRARVPFEQAPTTAGTLPLTFTVADSSGAVRDRVEAKIPVQAPGVDERPALHGSFVGQQSIALEVPQDVFVDASGEDFLTVTVGENHWPELGSRLEYLVDYPHGCVEQTTSSTLPLLAAREILPRLGVTRFSDDDLRPMIQAGVERLATMRTREGGLAYWPGGHDPNPFGTAYATQALSRAEALGVEVPEGMLDGIREYLVRMVEARRLPGGYGVEVRASVALALAQLEALPPSIADSLYDTVPNQGVFGRATLALALSSLPDQGERVRELLDGLETAFDDSGDLIEARRDDFGYYGSDQRSIAQSALALHRLRPESNILPRLTQNLLQRTAGYTTQGTAYGLLALTERVHAEVGTAARQRAMLDGEPLNPELSNALALGPSVREYRIPLADLKGKRVILDLQSESAHAQSFTVRGRWRRASNDESGLAGTTTTMGPDLYRVITDAKGRSVDFDAIEPGQVLRVVLLARMPSSLDYDRRGYLAITDRLPAGFEAMQPDLWTVSSVPDLDDEHPLYRQLRWTGSNISHAELRDDRAHFYFDRFWGQWVHATYLMRATTPGHFEAPPAMAELMYEPDSAGYSQARSYTVVP